MQLALSPQIPGVAGAGAQLLAAIGHDGAEARLRQDERREEAAARSPREGPAAGEAAGLEGPAERPREVREMKQVVTLREAGLPVSVDRLNRFEAQRRALEARLRELGRHTYLTPNEQREVMELKKQKLWAKDQIAALRSR